jgi:hypothetical protein
MSDDKQLLAVFNMFLETLSETEVNEVILRMERYSPHSDTEKIYAPDKRVEGPKLVLQVLWRDPKDNSVKAKQTPFTQEQLEKYPNNAMVKVFIGDLIRS